MTFEDKYGANPPPVPRFGGGYKRVTSFIRPHLFKANQYDTFENKSYALSEWLLRIAY